MTDYPWQNTQWQMVNQSFEEERLPSALLLTGPEGMGQLHFAQQLAQLILTRDNSVKMQALLQGGTHPDFLLIQPQADKHAISIEQIREINQLNQATAQQGQYKVVIIEPAEAMTVAASNALLKSLEEPSASTFIFLASYQAHRLLATLRSRCQKIKFQPSFSQATLDWLAHQLNKSNDYVTSLLSLAQGAPLQALTLADVDSMQQRKQWFNQLTLLCEAKVDLITLAEQWHQQAVNQLLRCLSRWWQDMIKIRLSVALDSTMPVQYGQQLKKMSHLFDLSSLFAIVENMDQLRADLSQQTSLNTQMQLESLLIQIKELSNDGK